MENEIETDVIIPAESPKITLNRRVRNLNIVFFEGLSGVERKRLPDMETSLFNFIVSEAFRLAAADFGLDKPGWSVMNVHYLRSWALSKIRGILVGDDNVIGDAVMSVFDGVRGPNMVFLGDFIRLPRGYYAHAPTRVIQIRDGIYALISSEPSAAFRRRNLQIQINGLGRWIVDIDPESLMAKDISFQTKESYLGYSVPIHDPQTFMEDLATHGLKSEWTMLPGSEMYLGPVADRYNFLWGGSSTGVDTSIGRVKIVRLPREFSRYDYFLRIDDRSGAHRIQLDPKESKRALLAYDALANSPRKAVFAKRDSAVILELDFSPPAAETRWMCILGGAWLGSSGSRIRWIFPETVMLQVEEMLRDMWLKLDVRGR